MPDPTPFPGTIGDKKRKKPAPAATPKPFNYDTGKDPSAKPRSGDLIQTGLDKAKKVGKRILPFV